MAGPSVRDAPTAARPLFHRPSALFAVAWVALQVGVPAALLVRSDRPVPFGWQMYSATRTPPLVLVEGAAGELREASFFDYVPRPRADIAYGELLPPYLCRELPGALAVHFRDRTESPPDRHPCS